MPLNTQKHTYLRASSDKLHNLRYHLWSDKVGNIWGSEHITCCFLWDLVHYLMICKSTGNNTGSIMWLIDKFSVFWHLQDCVNVRETSYKLQIFYTDESSKRTFWEKDLQCTNISLHCCHFDVLLSMSSAIMYPKPNIKQSFILWKKGMLKSKLQNWK